MEKSWNFIISFLMDNLILFQYHIEAAVDKVLDSTVASSRQTLGTDVFGTLAFPFTLIYMRQMCNLLRNH